jgi:hypothetical protein
MVEFFFQKFNETIMISIIKTSISFATHLGSCIERQFESASLSRMKQLGLGIASSCVITPAGSAFTFLAQKMNFITTCPQDLDSDIRSWSEKLMELGLKINSQAVIEATCKFEEIINQLNSNLIEQARISTFTAKVAQIGLIGCIFPVAEEITFRGLIQDVCLKKITQPFLKKIFPNTQTSLLTAFDKVTRVTIAAGLFSACHLQNTAIFDDEYVRGQLIHTFVMGLGLGVLKESNAGILGAIGAHIANNFAAISPVLMTC